jgi:hypothetical protein
MRLHLTISKTQSGELEIRYLGTDRKVARAELERPGNAVTTELYSFIERTAVRHFEAKEGTKKKSKE